MFNFNYLVTITLIFLFVSHIAINQINIDNFYYGVLLNVSLLVLLILLLSSYTSLILIIIFFFFFIAFDLLIVYFYVYNKFNITLIKNL